MYFKILYFEIKLTGKHGILKDSLYGKLSFFTHFSKFVVFIRVM